MRSGTGVDHTSLVEPPPVIEATGAASEEDLDAIRDGAARALGDRDTAEAMRSLLDTPGAFDRDLWRTAADLGWLGVGVPEAAGGFGLDLAARCVLAEEVGRALAAIPFSVHSAATCALATWGGEAQHALVGEAVAGRRILTIADASAGRRGSQPTLKVGRLCGLSPVVEAGAFADHLLLACADGALALVDLGQPEVTRRVVDSIDNSRGHAELRFDGAATIPLGDAGAARRLLDELALTVAFEQAGGAAACLVLTRDYALQRRAFGQPIGAFQAVKHALADAYVLVEVVRGAALGALRAAPGGFSHAVACARVAATRAYEQGSQESIQLHGGIGGTWEATPHLHFRRSRCLAQAWGTETGWRERILNLAATARAATQDGEEEADDLAAYRARARVFLAENAPHFRGSVRVGLSVGEDLALGRAWQRLKAAHRFAAITLPTELSGGGGTPVQKAVFAQEEAKYDLPTGYFSVSMGMPVPILAAYGSDALKQALIPPAIRGETIACQLFSEPAAGSDLAALRMSARREGDHWILNGQKLWTSWAHISDWGILVARHDPDLPKHQGLTYFVVDMKSPGVTVRPVRMMGPNHVNEVFFDEVAVHDAHRLGAVGDGFRIALHTLMIERYAVTDPWGYGPDPMLLFGDSRWRDGLADKADPDLRAAAAQAIYEAQALGEINRRAFQAIAAGREPGPEGSITKLVLMASRQRLARAAMDAAGPAALERRAGASTRDDFVESWLLAPLSRIAGGTDQILRNTIAERILGLPQDHRPDKGVAFRDIPR